MEHDNFNSIELSIEDLANIVGGANRSMVFDKGNFMKIITRDYGVKRQNSSKGVERYEPNWVERGAARNNDEKEQQKIENQSNW